MTLVCLDRHHEAFPARLVPIPDPPGQLWVRGDPARLPAPDDRALALVGTRAASRDGLELTRRLADALARVGVVIVSGMARGIDAAAHRATLDAGGRTVAVLGSGLHRLYPPEHSGLADAIAASGALVSEFSPDTPPDVWTFPRRNRLIAGLADAVVVIEAPEKSGALITASAALEQGKDVLVVPGRVAGGRYRGGHLLICDGAQVVETADDILSGLGWLPTRSIARGRGGNGPEPVEFTVDEVASETGETTEAVLARLLELELAGQIRRVGSARFLGPRNRVLT